MSSQKKMLYLASGVSLPIQAVTHRLGIFGVSGSGKTYTASVLAEEMLTANAHVVILDPLGVWYGLRAVDAGATDAEPLPVYILGGDHADLPLDPTSGVAVADLVTEERLSVILDLSAMEQEQQARFASSFAKQLYAQSRVPLHLIIDEADIFAPETPGSSTEWECRRAIDTIVRRGRVRGLGVTLLSQRPAVVAKNVLTQTGTLIVHRTASPQDQKAVDSWFKAHGGETQRKQVLSTLASLPVGEAWLWSPSDLELFERIRVRRRRTYDSSATPTVGVERKPPRRLLPVDLSLLKDRLTSAIQHAEENDPTRLRAKIATLARQLAERPVTVERIVEEKIVEKRVEVPILTPEALKHLKEAMDTAASVGKEIGAFHALITGLVEHAESGGTTEIATLQAPAEHNVTPPAPMAKLEQKGGGQKLMASGKLRILEALARYPRMRLSPAQVGSLTRLTPSGGTWNRYLIELKREGFVRTLDGGDLQITEAGIHSLGRTMPPEPHTLDELLSLWRSALRRREYEILLYLIQEHPRSVPLPELASHFGLAHRGGTFNSYIGTLRKNKLVQTQNGFAHYIFSLPANDTTRTRPVKHS